jgi:DNA polymerase III subunit beta
MQFTINREAFLKPLQLVTAVIERRQTVPILSNIVLELKDKELSLLGTDMEVELLGKISLEETGKAGETTVPARKLVDICRNLPEGSGLEFQQKDNKLILQCGRSRFNLATLPVSDFPRSEEFFSIASEKFTFKLSQKQLRSLIEATNFAMAQQDVRFYLNGMLWELSQGSVRAVATDGHRLALSTKEASVIGDNQIIVPRKAIYELLRLLDEDESDLTILLNNNQLRVNMQNYTFTSKLIEGKFPNYDHVIPQSGDKILNVDRDLLKASLTRVGVLSNDKHRSICLEMKDNSLRIFANNLEQQEEAEDHLDVLYTGEAMTIAFNISYLMDVLGSLPAGLVKITLTATDTSVRLESAEETTCVYVIMPMRL